MQQISNIPPERGIRRWSYPYFMADEKEKKTHNWKKHQCFPFVRLNISE